MHTVFQNIVGGDEFNCAAALEDITIRPDYPAGGNPTPICTNPEIFAGTVRGDTALPLIVLRPSTLAHGGINAGTPGGPDAVTCHSISTDGDRVTYRMEAIGSVLLHEYTHCAFVSNPVSHVRFLSVTSSRRDFHQRSFNPAYRRQRH